MNCLIFILWLIGAAIVFHLVTFESNCGGGED